MQVVTKLEKNPKNPVNLIHFLPKMSVQGTPENNTIPLVHG